MSYAPTGTRLGLELLQDLITRVQDAETADLSGMLGGYDLSDAGKLVWGQD